MLNSKQQVGGDNILVYQRLSELAEAHTLENRQELYIALCSLTVIGYRKFLGSRTWGTLMTIEKLANALFRLGKNEEASSLYQQAFDGYVDILEYSCRDVCKASGPHSHEPPGTSYRFRTLEEVWCQREECGHGIRRHSRKMAEGSKLDGSGGSCKFEDAKDRKVNLLQCLLVKYLDFELREDTTQNYLEFVEQLAHLRSLYEKATPQEASHWASNHWMVLNLYEEKRKYRGKTRFWSIIARQAMDIKTRYPSSWGIHCMLF
jgi:tetratricopeptide (TPR) repeat protein